MKYINVILICIALLLCGCGIENEAISQAFSEQSVEESAVNLQGEGDESTFDSQSEAEESVSDNQSEATMDNNSADDTESYIDVSESETNSMMIQFFYDNWDDLVHNHADELNSMGFELDGARIAELLGTEHLEYRYDRIRFFDSYKIKDTLFGYMVFTLCIYPVTEEIKDRKPWYYGQSEITESQVYELEDFHKGRGAYRFTKEGMDLYATTNYSGDNYDVCFQIGDYIFEVISSFQDYYYNPDNGYRRELMPQEMCDKLLEGYEQHAAFHELCDFSTEESELVLLLKELVAAAENDGTVKE